MTLISVSILLIILIMYALFTRLTISKFGTNSQNYHTAYMKNMMEGIKSYKEILLSGKQKHVLKSTCFLTKSYF